MAEDSGKIDLLCELAAETREDVKTLIEVQAQHGQRLAALESRPPAPPTPAALPAPTSLARDATLVGSAGAIVGGIIAALQALGVVPK